MKITHIPLHMAAALLAACSAPVPPAAPAGRVVDVATPVSADGAVHVSGIGRLAADAEAALGFTSGGVIAAIDVDIGDRVRTGQVLARLDSTVLDADARDANEQVAQARRDLARVESLVQRQLVARQQLDDARTRLDVAEARLRTARFGQRFGQIVAAENGTVLERLIEPGEVVSAGQPVLRVSGEERGWILAVTLADRDGLRVRPGSGADVRFDALPGRVFPATVTRVAGEANASSGGILVELAIAGLGVPLRSGLVGKARIATEVDDAGLRIPASALVEAGTDGALVYVVEDGRARRRSVRLGDVRPNGVTVVEGLTEDEIVVVGGAAFIEDGTAVRVAPGA